MLSTVKLEKIETGNTEKLDNQEKEKSETKKKVKSESGKKEKLVNGKKEKGMATTSRTRKKETAEKKGTPSPPAAGTKDDRLEAPPPSDATLNNLRTAFQLLDRDSDGRVTPEELQHMLRKIGIEVKDELIAELIQDASQTGDGTVDENDFMQWVVKIQAIQGLIAGDLPTSAPPHDSEEELTRDLLAAFRVFDRDCNGYITTDELRTALELIGEPVTDAQLKQILAIGDIDKDGRIDYEEFLKLLL